MRTETGTPELNYSRWAIRFAGLWLILSVGLCEFAGPGLFAQQSGYRLRPLVTEQALGSRPASGLDLSRALGLVVPLADHTLVRVSIQDGWTVMVHSLAGVPNNPGDVDGNCNEATFNRPEDVAIDVLTSSIYVADTGNGSIRRIFKSPRHLCTVETVLGGLVWPRSVRVGRLNGHRVLVIAEAGSNLLRIEDLDTGHEQKVSVEAPRGLTVIDDAILVGSRGRIYRVESDLIPRLLIRHQFSELAGLSVGLIQGSACEFELGSVSGEGLFVTDTARGAIYTLDCRGTIVRIAGIDMPMGIIAPQPSAGYVEQDSDGYLTCGVVSDDSAISGLCAPSRPDGGVCGSCGEQPF